MNTKTIELLVEVIKTVFTFAGLFVTAYYSYRAVQTSKENKVTIGEVAKKVDGLLDEKSRADKAIGKLEAHDELKTEGMAAAAVITKEIIDTVQKNTIDAIKDRNVVNIQEAAPTKVIIAEPADVKIVEDKTKEKGK